jgi:hypothetical protein
MRLYIYRFAAPISALLVFFAMSYLYAYGSRQSYFYILQAYGVLPSRFPFLDTAALLSAWECARQGIDVIPANPCDVLHRPFDYSPLWMAAAAIPVGGADAMAVGWGLGFIFLLSLSLLPAPRLLSELMLVVAATLSTTVVFAVERANADLLMFLLALAAGLLAVYRLPVCLFGYGLGLLAASVKYYPIMILIAAFRERSSVFWAVGLTTIGSVVAFWAAYHADIVRGLAFSEDRHYVTEFFSAQNLPFLFGEIAGNATDSALIGRLEAGGFLAALVALCAAVCARLLRFTALRSALHSLPDVERVLLVIGSSVIVGCFFAGQSIVYRGVFLLMVLPGLLTISRSPTRGLRNLALGTSLVIVLLMWSECFRIALWTSRYIFGFWLLRELCWWWSISVMLTVLIDFLWSSFVLRQSLSLFRRAGRSDCKRY